MVKNVIAYSGVNWDEDKNIVEVRMDVLRIEKMVFLEVVFEKRYCNVYETKRCLKHVYSFLNIYIWNIILNK